MKHVTRAGISLCLVAVLAGCGAKEQPATGSGTSGGSPATTTKAPATTAVDPCAKTSIAVKSGTGTAEIDGTTSYADITGSGPQSGTFTLANYAIPEADARGVLQPSGLETGKAVVIITVTAPEIAPGTYVDQTDKTAGEKKINFFSIYTSDGRALPTADHELTIARVGDRVCGSLQPAAGSTNGATATGTFAAKRIDTGPTTKYPASTGGGGTTTRPPTGTSR